MRLLLFLIVLRVEGLLDLPIRRNGDAMTLSFSAGDDLHATANGFVQRHDLHARCEDGNRAKTASCAAAQLHEAMRAAVLAEEEESAASSSSAATTTDYDDVLSALRSSPCPRQWAITCLTMPGDRTWFCESVLSEVTNSLRSALPPTLLLRPERDTLSCLSNAECAAAQHIVVLGVAGLGLPLAAQTGGSSSIINNSTATGDVESISTPALPRGSFVYNLEQFSNVATRKQLIAAVRIARARGYVWLDYSQMHLDALSTGLFVPEERPPASALLPIGVSAAQLTARRSHVQAANKRARKKEQRRQRTEQNQNQNQNQNQQGGEEGRLAEPSSSVVSKNETDDDDDDDDDDDFDSFQQEHGFTSHADVVSLGVGERRLAVLEALRRKGHRAYALNGMFEGRDVGGNNSALRDAFVGTARVGLALRRSPDRKALEAVRLTYYASVGLPAVAERSDDAAADAAFAPMVRFVEAGAPVAAIAAAVEELLAVGGAPALAALRANATAVAEQRSATTFLVDLLRNAIPSCVAA
jgi:hypothetical protein